MPESVIFVLLKVLLPVLFLAYTAYLLYARYHPEVAETKYKADPQSIKLYKKMYSTYFLILVASLALSFALDLGITIFELLHGSVALLVKVIIFPIRMALGCVGVYFAYLLFWKKK